MLFYAGWGFLVWLVATVVFRLAGHAFFDPDRPVLMLIVFLLTIPLIAAVTYPVYRWRRTSLADRPLAAVLLVLPGMVLDIFSLAFYDTLFGNLDGDGGSYFGAWLLWAYALVLATAVVPEPQARRV